MKKIVFVTAEYSDESCGGAGVYAYELAKSLAKQAMNVYVITPSKIAKTVVVSPNLTVEYVKTVMLPILRTPTFWIAANNAIKRIEKDHRIDVIHSNNNAAVLVQSKSPLVTTIQHPAKMDNQSYSFLQKLLNLLDIWAENRMVNISKGILSTSISTKQLIEEIYPIAKKKISFIPIGIDMNFYKKNIDAKHSIRDKFKIKDKFPIIFFPGGMRGRRKGLETVAKAVTKLDDLNFHLLISGSSRELGWKKLSYQFISSDSMKVVVRLCGEINYKDLPMYYSAADFVIFPSLFEGYGLPSLESLACETPVISTNTGEASSIVRDGENGLLIDTGNSEQLSRSMNKLLSSQETLSSMRLRSRASIADKYSWNTISKMYVNFYDRI